MQIIGVTGGVGCGKSCVLDYLEEKYSAYVLKADELAGQLREPGGSCYEPLIALLGEGILDPETGRIDKARMAQRIFSDRALLQKVNDLMHPMVREEILRRIGEKRNDTACRLFVLEAALLLEEGYDSVTDQMWYIHADEAVRRKRLKAARGYSDEKITSIMQKQLPEEEFRRRCDTVIDNSGDIGQTRQQIDAALGALTERR